MSDHIIEGCNREKKVNRHLITIYPAKKILTMNPARPVVDHVAVRDGLIIGAGTLDELRQFGDFAIDETFTEKVLMPGFVEGHAHTMEGTLWRHFYCGYFDRMDPEGRVWPGIKSKNEVLERLREAEKKLDDPAAAIPGWQLDPIYYENERITRKDLDTISTVRPIGLLHASGHILTVNSKALELAGYLKTGINHPGIPLDDDGLPEGELRGPDVMTPVFPHIGFGRDMLDCDERGLRDFGKLCVRAGVTTITDLAARLDEELLDTLFSVTGEPSYPARLVPFRFFHGLSPKELIEHAKKLKVQSTDKLILGNIKIVTDGSIQGFTARLRSPGYYNGAPNGLWYVAPDQLKEVYELSLENGLLVHTHTNGDEATQLAIETLETALRKHPSFDHRFTLQHCQLADSAQFRKMGRLGMCANLFANHTFYWGDEHYTMTVGPERAERMNACATALENDVPIAIHSDAPITPLAPLYTAWCAVNRVAASGRLLGEHERISVDEALRTITLGAAFTLKMDDQVGSIETGKRADFAVLEDDPTQVDPMALKDIPVWGTVVGGKIFSAAEI